MASAPPRESGAGKAEWARRVSAGPCVCVCAFPYAFVCLCKLAYRGQSAKKKKRVPSQHSDAVKNKRVGHNGAF